MEVVEALVFGEGDGLEAIAEVAAGSFEAFERLFERVALRGGGGQGGDLGDAEQDVVEGFDVAVGGQGLGDGAGVGVGDGEERREGGLEVGLDGGDVAEGFLVDGGGGLPAVGVDEGEGLLEVVERGLEDDGGEWGSGRSGYGGWSLCGCGLCGEGGAGCGQHGDEEECGGESRHVCS